MRAMNVVYLNSHDTGRYIEPYGHRVPTPRMSRLAGESVVFRNAFSAAPTCSPSRAGLLTGQAAHSCGMLGLAHLGWSLADPGQHLLHTLAAGGCRTVLAGLQHVARGTGDQYADAESLGYDTVLPKEDGERHAAEFIRTAGRDRPFYLEVGFFETHRFGKLGGAFSADGPQGSGDFAEVPAILPDTAATRADFADFAAAAGRLDAKIGVVLDALAEAGLEDDTIVICTTDHGIPFPGMKCNLTDHGIAVMLMMRLPGSRPRGRVVDAMVSQIDVFPTVCELLGLDPPAWLQGSSLMPLVRGEADSLHEEIFAEVTYHARYEPQRAVRTDRWKYIQHFGADRNPQLGNCDPGPSKELLVDHGWATSSVADEELYDLLFDPQERHNLASLPVHAKTVDDLRERLSRWMHDTADPLVAGAVPEPGARS